MANSSILRAIFKAIGGISLFAIIIFLQGCIIYSKPAYSGRVIDVDNGAPIQGVQVDVIYRVGYQTIVEQNTKQIAWAQAITNGEGYFEFPAFTTLKDPFSWDEKVLFSFEKEGYSEIRNINLGDCFSVGCDKRVFEKENIKIIVSSHLVELSKTKNN